MKRADRISAAIATVVVAGIIFCLGAIVGTITAEPKPPQHAVCLQSHREVVLIPTICGAHDICQKPVVTDVCDRIQAPPPRPMCQGNNNDDE